MIKEKKVQVDSFDKIPEFIEYLKSEENVLACYQFGSTAENSIAPLSDIDIAVLIDPNLNKNERFDYHLKLIGVANEIMKTDEVDLVILNDAPLGFGYEILRTGKLMFYKDKYQVADYFERTCKLYLDFRIKKKEFDFEFQKGLGLKI